MKSVFIASAFAALVAAAPVEKRTPPNIPSTSSANSLLAGLTVKAQGPQTGEYMKSHPRHMNHHH
jgi:hypothetical protein